MSALPDFRDDHRIEHLRVPPHSIEAEQSVLGGLMQVPASLAKVADWLSAEDFYRRDHQSIYRAIGELAEKGTPCDAVTLGDWFAGQGMSELVDGGAYLIDLASNIPSAANIVAYAEIVKDKANRRRVIEIGTAMVNDGFTSPADLSEIVAKPQRNLLELRGDPRTGGLVSASAGLKDWFDDLQERFYRGDATTGLPYPWAALNEITHGLQPGELTIIAGRPSMGKSIIGLNVATMNAMRGVNVGFMSLEMTRRQINRRNIAALASIPHDWLLAPSSEGDYWPQVTNAIKDLKAAKLFVDDTSGMTIDQIAARLRCAHMQHPLELIVLDHMHDVRLPSKRDARFEVGDIAAAGKDLAKEFNCPAIWLAQLSRSLESRADKRPTMADLRESGEIEQKADVIIFVYREDYYQRTNPGWQKRNDVELILAKGRDLNTDNPTVVLRNEYGFMRATDWDTDRHGPVPTRQAVATSNRKEARN